MLKRHLTAAHGLTVDGYRERLPRRGLCNGRAELCAETVDARQGDRPQHGGAAMIGTRGTS
jgi:hypothetical protein